MIEAPPHHSLPLVERVFAVRWHSFDLEIPNPALLRERHGAQDRFQQANTTPQPERDAFHLRAEWSGWAQ